MRWCRNSEDNVVNFEQMGIISYRPKARRIGIFFGETLGKERLAYTSSEVVDTAFTTAWGMMNIFVGGDSDG